MCRVCEIRQCIVHLVCCEVNASHLCNIVVKNFYFRSQEEPCFVHSDRLLEVAYTLKVVALILLLMVLQRE